MALRSRIPRIDGVDPVLFRYLESLDRRVPARDDLSSSATLAEMIDAYNELLSDLRDAGLMEN